MAKHKHSVGRLREMASKLPKNHRPEGGGLRIMQMLTKIGRLPGWQSFPFAKEKQKQEVQYARSNFRGSAKGNRLEQPFYWGHAHMMSPQNLGFLDPLPPPLSAFSQ